jgi:hypothetical protein
MKTGIELLQDLFEKVELLERRFTLIEQNTKEILNRLNVQSMVPSAPLPEPKNNMKPMITSSVPMPTNEPQEQSGAMTRVMSKIKNKEDKMMAGVSIKIYKNDVFIRETKTNRAGEWQCFLAPGNYRADYFQENVINTSSFFTVTSDQQLLRVPQPGV